MKIATWNVERLSHRKYLGEIISECNRIAADIMVLTETDNRIKPDYGTCVSTENLLKLNSAFYGNNENRAAIYSTYKAVRLYETFDKYTAVCVELETEKGNLLVYGIIIGVYGNRHKSFKTDLMGFVNDMERFSQTGKPVCVCGDYNLSFADNYYYTKEGRDTVLQTFSKNRIALLTQGVGECIDHIAVSEGFLNNKDIRITEWNTDKKLSDHKGTAVEFD